ncbi:SIR2 family NAD-dependent protein deacylase [Ruegeria atlantica]|uniref:SIR2 family NAD-dependent protein deacylase n=1 Tax=Ruegeria atlantica TaxID=81569 RepID=UPI00147E5717|nr:SIR2 family protein [Ruegeria atlantica]
MAVELTYKQAMDVAIRDLLQDFEVQPILFIGSGMSRRYFGAPTWIELLREVRDIVGEFAPDFDYFRQKYEGDPEKIGSALSEFVFEWAWKDGKLFFPPEYFSEGVSKEAFIKHLCCMILSDKTPNSVEKDHEYFRELEALKSVRPHAIITTNYDLFLETLFEGYEAISGQTILRYNANSFGEIFHIHGDVEAPETIVLTENDYAEWGAKKKYVSAKLLTYFAEHPVFIFGYSVTDGNVKSIVRDIAQILECGDGLIPNIFHVIWDPEKDGSGRPDVSVIQCDDREYRVQAIYTSEFRWVFDALKSKAAMTSVNPKLIRALAARTLKLIRTDIPTGSVQVNYDILEKVAKEKDELPNLLGISATNNPNLSHPFTISQVAKKIGVGHWSRVNKMIHQIKTDTGIDLRSSDNSYHCQIKTGAKSTTRKWSHAAIDLFEAIKQGQNYELSL